jgi:hypothetical protein
LEASRSNIKDLPVDSRFHLGQFVDEIQARLPSLTQKELSAAIEVLSKLEKSRSGYALLEQLAKLQPDDLDELNNILDNWSIHEVRIVMSELEWRLKLIQQLEALVESPSSDELHDIQPLFERGLWIFGPEYEAISFASNRTLVTVVEKLFAGKIVRPLDNPRKRPDFVALPDSTVGIYSSDAFDERSEVNGIDKVLIIELKKGGFEITSEECHEAQKYAFELRKSDKIQRHTMITAFVLGTTVADEAKGPITIGDGETTKIYARTYSTVLRQAHARTFNLLKRIQEVRQEELYDPEVEQIINAPEQSQLLVS